MAEHPGRVGYGVHAEGWKRAVAALQDWGQEHGGVDSVPPGLVEGGVRLRAFMHRRRHEYRTGTLDTDQVRQLEALPGWSWGSSHQQGWDTAYQAVAGFARAHGHVRLPTHLTADGTNLGRWASTQRSAYRRGRLPRRRIRALQQIPGWWWTR